MYINVYVMGTHKGKLTHMYSVHYYVCKNKCILVYKQMYISIPKH